MIENHSMQKGINIIDMFKVIKYKRDFNKTHPNYFEPCGLCVFCGGQGSGKTLSAVCYVINLMKAYPMSLLITNVNIKEFPVDNKRVFCFKNNDDFMKYENGEQGVIYFVDEIQLYLNSLESKNINLDVVSELSQQRKQRKHIIATSQIFGRMAKPLREQFSEVIACKNYLHVLQCNQLIDRDSIDSEGDVSSTNITGEVKEKYWFFHSPRMYEAYDTYAKIKNNKFIASEKKKGEIYVDRLSRSNNNDSQNN